MPQKFKTLLALIAPGILLAATGVGTGDLATAAFTGSKLGLSVLWAVILGAFFKFVLNEGLTRWQLATGRTLLEGTASYLGRPTQYIFLAYLLIWTFLVTAALMSACGVVLHAICPVFYSATTGKIVFGILSTFLCVLLVQWGGYSLFEKMMSICIGIMFVTVVVTAILLKPQWNELLHGLFIPGIAQADATALTWTVALMGGVGGTVTVLCYGYWIREVGRFGKEQLGTCRIDLACGYSMTALFGLAMVVIGSHIEVQGAGAKLVVILADKLGEKLGSLGRWLFLAGACGAVFSSLLGILQSIPYLFADLCRLMRTPQVLPDTKVDIHSKAYQWYLYGMATIPLIGLWIGFARMQKLYAVVGALFMPMLALVLLLLNSHSKWVGSEHRNHPLTSALLITILLFFFLAGWLAIIRL